jgi:hypothetical protein
VINGGKKMKVNFSKFITISIVLLFAACILSNVSTVEAQTISLQEKGISITNDVVGIDITKYAVITEERSENPYLGIVPQDYIKITLDSNQTSINIAYNFINGHLQMIHVLEGHGLPTTNGNVNAPIEMAKEFLKNYEIMTKNSLYNNLLSILTISEKNNCSTIVNGDVRLDVSTSESTTFRWTYSLNGIDAPVKCVVLSFSKGFLNYFIDNWNIYEIGSNLINLTEKEAASTGIAKTRTYSYTIGSGNETYRVNNLNATKAMIKETIYGNSLSADTARDNNPLKLYPIRHVWVSLDKFYPGNVYGIEVLIWADTKEVFSVNERSTTIDPPKDLIAKISDTSNSSDINHANSIIAQMLMPLISISIVAGIFFTNKGRLSKNVRRTGGILLCVLIGWSLFLPISTVNAVDKSSIVWGSRSSGASDPGINDATWRKTSNELGNQSAVASDVSYSFSYYGEYSDANNYQGSNSIKYEIRENISDSQNNNAFTAILDFDHGVGNFYPNPPGYFHFMFEDDVGTVTGSSTYRVPAPENGVYDNEVYSDTGGGSSESNINFVYISACMSAALFYPNVTMPFGGGFYYPNGPEVGMPFAWTHRTVGWMGYESEFNTAQNISLFGYSEPDAGEYCYVGFPYGSAALSQTSIEDGYTQTTYASWVEEFYAYALMYDYSVHDALDEASLMCFTRDFGSTALYNNFTAIWPMWLEHPQDVWDWQEVEGINPQTTNCTLAIYGNSNMHLSAKLTVSTKDQIGNPLVANVYMDNELMGTTDQNGELSIILPLGYHTIDVEGWIWDEYWQQYVFPLGVPRSLTVTSSTGDTSMTIYYTY